MANAAAEPSGEEIIRSCEANLELFNQYSGQCWNDSSIVFLLFSNYLGDFTQRKMTLPEDEFAALFDAFCRANRVFINHVAEHNLSDEELDGFIKTAVVYIHCLLKRFRNWKINALRAKSTVRPPLERCDSYLYSLCLEAAGPTANEYLFPVMPPLESEAPGFANKPISEQRNIRAREALEKTIYRQPIESRNTSKGFLEKAEEYRSRENRNVNALTALGTQFSNIRGYDTFRFSRLIALLIYFFSDKTITIAKLLQRDPETETPYYYLSDPQKNILFYSKYTRLSLISRIIQPYEEDDSDDKIINYLFLLEPPPELIFSTNVACYSIIESGLTPTVEGHAITFLECGGKQFIYDDNVHSLVECKWRELFTEKYNLLYYCFSKEDGFSVVAVKKGETVGGEEVSAEVKIIRDTGAIKNITIKKVGEPFGKQIYFFLKDRVRVGNEFIFIIDGFPFFIFDMRSLPEPEPAAAEEGGRRRRFKRATRRVPKRRGRKSRGMRRGLPTR